MPPLAVNKRARFDYEILETFEGGLKLTGPEVKSAKAGHVQLKGAFIQVRGGEVWLKNAFIAKYQPAGPQPDYDPSRDRKILIHRRELARLTGKQETKGMTIVPLSIFLKGDLLKVDFGVGRGKKKYEKRESIKKRDVERHMREELKR